MTESLNNCGDCEVCCISLDIVELDKPGEVRCKNLCSTGCSIYPNRPSECREFSCLWITLEEADTSFRPNNCNLLCMINTFGAGLPRIQITELDHNAADTKEGRAWIAKLRESKHKRDDGTDILLPVCVIRYVPDTRVDQRPSKWYVKRESLLGGVVTESLQTLAKEENSLYECKRNDICPCGTGLKFKKCHANFADIIIN